MSMQFYAPPEQVMKDRADYARKNIARGRPLVAVTYDDGILLVAENLSKSLHKISEIYDRIAFAGVGRYNEFDQLRVAGVRHADTKGYAYSREDVDARSLANSYAQFMGQVFTHELKPLEVEILVAELGVGPESDQLYHILYDGTVVDEERFTVLGGDADEIRSRMEHAFGDRWSLHEAVPAVVGALGGPDRSLESAALEVAVLARSNGRRAFRRIGDGELTGMLGEGGLPPDGQGSAPEAGCGAGSSSEGHEESQ